jgi:hypothetical protein
MNATRGRTFTLTEDHLKLARRMSVDWWADEFGAPGIDPKRPYGNSDVIEDVLDIVGADPGLGDKGNVARAVRLHEGMQTALEIFLRTGSFEVGYYACAGHGQDWRRV